MTVRHRRRSTSKNCLKSTALSIFVDPAAYACEERGDRGSVTRALPDAQASYEMHRARADRGTGWHAVPRVSRGPPPQPSAAMARRFCRGCGSGRRGWSPLGDRPRRRACARCGPPGRSGRRPTTSARSSRAPCCCARSSRRATPTEPRRALERYQDSRGDARGRTDGPTWWVLEQAARCTATTPRRSRRRPRSSTSSARTASRSWSTLLSSSPRAPSTRADTSSRSRPSPRSASPPARASRRSTTRPTEARTSGRRRRWSVRSRPASTSCAASCSTRGRRSAPPIAPRT